MDGYNHYIRINADNIVIDRYSEWQEDRRAPDEICVATNAGRHYNEPYTNDRGQYMYRWTGTEQVLRDQAELDSEWAARPPGAPSEADRLSALEAMMNAMFA